MESFALTMAGEAFHIPNVPSSIYMQLTVTSYMPLAALGVGCRTSGQLRERM